MGNLNSKGWHEPTVRAICDDLRATMPGTGIAGMTWGRANAVAVAIEYDYLDPPIDKATVERVCEWLEKRPVSSARAIREHFLGDEKAEPETEPWQPEPKPGSPDEVAP